MVSHPRNLAAWLDNELPEAEAAGVTEHVEGCAECRARARAYAEVSASLTQIAPAVVRPRRWPRVAALAGAVAAAILVAVAVYPRKTAEPVAVARETRPPVERKAPLLTAESAPKPQHRVATKMAKRKSGSSGRAPRMAPACPAQGCDGPVIRVAFPADALFAPGTLPPGVEIYADVTLAADGSPRELRVIP